MCCQAPHTEEVASNLGPSFLAVSSTREIESERDLVSVGKIKGTACSMAAPLFSALESSQQGTAGTEASLGKLP